MNGLFKKLAHLKKGENIVYIALILLALILCLREYGLNSVLESAIILFCMFVPILNAIEIYFVLKARHKLWGRALGRGRVLYLIISSVLVVFLFFFVISDRFQLPVALFSLIMLTILFLINLLRTYFKE